MSFSSAVLGKTADRQVAREGGSDRNSFNIGSRLDGTQAPHNVFGVGGLTLPDADAVGISLGLAGFIGWEFHPDWLAGLLS